MQISSFIIAAHEAGLCKFDDNECLIRKGNEILQQKFLGDPSLGLASIDPLKITKMDLVQGGNATVQMNLKFRNVELLGLSKATVYKVSGFKKDADSNKLHFDLKTPLGTIVGPYEIVGKILILPITGNGNITLNLKNLDIHMKFLTSKVLKDGKTFMHVEKSKFSFDITG